MKKLSSTITLFLASILVTSCGGSSSGSSGSVVAENSVTENAIIDGNSSTTEVLLDRIKDYSTAFGTVTTHTIIKETSQTNNMASSYNMWDYHYSPSNINNTILFESYEVDSHTSHLPPLYIPLIAEYIYEYSPREPVQSENARKVTVIRYKGDGSYLSRITYDTLVSAPADGFKKEPEFLMPGLQQGTAYCDDVISTGEIDYSITGKLFWQIGDKSSMQISIDGFAINCSDHTVISRIESSSSTTSELTNHYPLFTLRGRSFQNVLEFTSITTIDAAENVAIRDVTKTYYQYLAGKIAEIETSCFGGSIGEEGALCTTSEEVAINVPTVPVQ